MSLTGSDLTEVAQGTDFCRGRVTRLPAEDQAGKLMQLVGI